MNGAAARAKASAGLILITGGAGFIGSNLAHRLLSEGHAVKVFDNISRAGVENNLKWLQETYGSKLLVDIADVRDRYALREALDSVTQVFHLAAQVAVTTSLDDPVGDFEINARGTLNLLEEVRALPQPPSLLFTSTNKVYGDLADVALDRDQTRYLPRNPGLRAHGIDETRVLSFHSPYGCSKGTADQYVLDYARVYGLKAAVFRMSCIYGEHQFGTEDQGWLAHFIIRALEGEPITIYGDGLQVRDVLWVDDLVEAMLLAQTGMDRLSGRAFNIGGGPENTLSLLETMDLIAQLHHARPRIRFEPWRTADQRYYVSDTRLFQKETGWRPQIAPPAGAAKLYRWLFQSRCSAASCALTSRLAS